MGKKIRIFIMIGFSIALFSISFFISSNYTEFKYIKEENEFNEKFNYVRIEFDKKFSSKKIDTLLRNKGIYEYMTDHILKIIQINGIDYANKVIGISENYNLDKYFHIEWLENGKEKILNSEKVVVIGEVLANALKKQNNLQYIEIDKEKYSIAGIIKDSQYLSFTTYIPIKYFYGKDVVIDTEQYFFDKNMNLNLGKIKYTLFDYYPKDILKEVIDKSQTIGEEIVNIFFGFSTIVIFTISYAYIEKRKYLIMRLVGAKPIHIFYENLKVILPIYVCSLVISSIVSYISIEYILNYIDGVFYRVDIINLILTGTIGLILVLITSILCMVKILKFNMLEEIK